MAYLGILVLGGLLVALIISGIIYLDTARRSLSVSKRLLLVSTFGVVSFGGFLVPYVYESQLAYAYLQVIKPEPILVSPYEWLTVSLATGTTISMISGSVYFGGVRYGQFEKE